MSSERFKAETGNSYPPDLITNPIMPLGVIAVALSFVVPNGTLSSTTAGGPELHTPGLKGLSKFINMRAVIPHS